MAIHLSYVYATRDKFSIFNSWIFKSKKERLNGGGESFSIDLEGALYLKFIDVCMYLAVC